MSDLATACILVTGDSLGMEKTLAACQGWPCLISIAPWVSTPAPAGVEQVPWQQAGFAATRNAMEGTAGTEWSVHLQSGDTIAKLDIELLSHSLRTYSQEGVTVVYADHREYVGSGEEGQLQRCSGAYHEQEAGSYGYRSRVSELAVRQPYYGRWSGAVHEVVPAPPEKDMRRPLWLAVHSIYQASLGIPPDTYRSLLWDRVQELPNDGASWLFLGLCHLLQADPQGAVEALHKSIAIRRSPEASKALAKAQMAQGDYQAAEVGLSEYLRSYPGDHQAWMTVLVCAHQRGNMDAMDYYLGKALKSPTEGKDLLARFALYSANKGGFSAKVPVYEKILENVPKS